MDKKNWQHIEALFHAALAQPAEQRNAFLRNADEPDEIVDAVREMLRADADGSATINQVIRDAGADLDPDTIGEIEVWVGRRIGVYEITEHIASGGMGAVYAARRADDAFRQRVAVKLLAAGLASGDARARFLSERQILADLNHPNIAQLIDGGATDEGVPYLIMEFIDGQPIDEYCDENRLTINQRLRLFQSVCDAVQYAHRRLIIHRDIKPSNILVTKEGIPKLLDFGVAKLMEPDEASAKAALTAAQMRWLTPQTASPEQIRGEQVTTACDVYALGVLLYRLVSGYPPYHLTTFTQNEIMRVVCDTVTRRPSDVVGSRDGETTSAEAMPTVEQISSARSTSSGALRKRLRGDIDNIVLVAMHKDANRRYATVDQLAQDVGNYLGGWPVRARADSWGYRSGKFIKRNRFAVAASALLTLLIAGLVSYYTDQVTQERDIAQDQRQRAEQVSEFMLDMFEAANPMAKSGEPVTAAAVLKNAVATIDDELGEQPRVRADLLVEMGNAYRGLGMWTEAVALIEKSVAIERANFGNTHVELAEALAHLGSTKTRLRRNEESQEHYAESLVIYRQLFGPVHSGFIDVLNAQGAVSRRLGDTQQALRYHQEAETYAQQLSDDPDAQYANVLMSTGITHYTMQNHDAAIRSLTRSLDASRKVLDPHHEQIFTTLAFLANASQSRGRLDEGIAYYQELIDLEHASIGPDHPMVARAHKNLSTIFRDSGEFDNAEREVRKAIEIHTANFGADNYESVRGRAGLAEILYETGNIREAQALVVPTREAMALATSPDAKATISIDLLAAQIARDLEEWPTAERRFARVLAAAPKAFGPRDPATARALAEYAYLKAAAGDAASAKTSIGSAVEMLESDHESSNTAMIFALQGEVLLANEDFANAAVVLRTALRQGETYLGPAHWRLDFMRSSLGQALYASGETATGEALMKDAQLALAQTRPTNDRYRRAASQRYCKASDACTNATP
ncbi:MAG: tetratricopeptide repeat protein [Gammaproteobacteria bacterium]